MKLFFFFLRSLSALPTGRQALTPPVHAGQFLSYLRTLDLERPNIWD